MQHSQDGWLHGQISLRARSRPTSPPIHPSHPRPQLYSPNLTKALGASEESPAQDKGAFYTSGAQHQSISSCHVLNGDKMKGWGVRNKSQLSSVAGFLALGPSSLSFLPHRSHRCYAHLGAPSPRNAGHP